MLWNAEWIFLPAILNRPFRHWSPLSQGICFVFQVHTYTCLIKIQHMFNFQRSEYLEEKCLLNPKEKLFEREKKLSKELWAFMALWIFFFFFLVFQSCSDNHLESISFSRSIVFQLLQRPSEEGNGCKCLRAVAQTTHSFLVFSAHLQSFLDPCISLRAAT